MTDQSERERLDEGLRLMRAFFRIKDGERRRGVIDLAERMARDLPPRSGRLHVVKSSEGCETRCAERLFSRESSDA